MTPEIKAKMLEEMKMVIDGFSGLPFDINSAKHIKQKMQEIADRYAMNIELKNVPSGDPEKPEPFIDVSGD